ncbi:hypothetical protein HD806DRAFT_525510 [Xylariaceae sp. AK1471]|nr:hypothetical protein HD806DRAFT_525510 [Xylariaceae sp. AK1471]
MADPSFGRLQAALAAATNEVTVAAANINFDFTLVKYEAPKEYQQLGNLLSSRRKEDAETGKSHITARRLAALFEGVCPDTPKLIAAYGQRVSDISQLTGVDATSIWAAATSTKDAKGSAIHVHLLACILTIWEPAEAISIWVELVQERRRAITKDLENGAAMPFSLAAAAAQQEIPRAELAKWDASARAWIETANSCSMILKPQTQLKLILENISLPIQKVESVYPSVIEVWRTSVTIMECVLSGIPQEVQDGTALLGLCSWNLYPDILVFGSKTVEVHMEDDLLPPGGILSLGCTPSATTPVNGISWSLSLAHLRYYGHPIKKQALLREDPSRLTASEFSQVVLGCIMGHWNINKEMETATLIFLHNFSEYALSHSNRMEKFNSYEIGGYLNSTSVFRFLQDATIKLMANEETGNQLLALGRKRSKFIPDITKDSSGSGTAAQRRSRPYFGLDEPQIFLSCLETTTGKVEFLRRIGGRVDALRSLSPIIRHNVRVDKYEEESEEKSEGESEEEYEGESEEEYEGESEEEYEEESGEKSTDEAFTNGAFNNNAVKKMYKVQADFATVFPLNDEGNDNITAGRSMMRSGQQHAQWTSDPEGLPLGIVRSGHAELIKRNYIFHNDITTFSRIMPNGGEKNYIIVYGDSQSAGIFVPDSSPDIRLLMNGLPAKVDMEDIHWALAHDLLRPSDKVQIAQDSVYRTLNILGLSSSVFTALPQRIIRIETLLQPLVDCSWALELIAQNYSSITIPFLSMAHQIAIISYFAGGCNIPSADVAPNSMGVSVGDSLYVPNWLLDDPLQASKRPFLVRILGNIGQPGFTIFSSVENPMASPLDYSNWRVTDQKAFNGKLEDALGATSMHLSFTSWERAIDQPGDQGNQDSRYRKMESIVSIRERGKWIGDVDMISALRSAKIYQLPPQSTCDHAPGSAPAVLMISVESWDDLCDLPAGLVVVRAHGNWLARLAVASFLAQQAEEHSSSISRITICPPNVCWRCVIPEFVNNVYIY